MNVNNSDIKSSTIKSPWQVIGSLLNSHKAAILSTLIAIGAYSKDSIIIQLIPKDNLRVTAKTTFIAPIGGAVGYVQWSSQDSIKFMAPYFMAILVNVRNDSNIDQNLGGISLEYKDSLNNWQPLTCLQNADGVYVSFEKEKANLIEFNDGNLLNILGETPLKPNVVYRGWILAQTLLYSENPHFKVKKLRLTFVSDFDETETHEIEMGNKHQAVNQFKGTFMTPKGQTVNLNNFRIAPLNNVLPDFSK